MGCTIAAVLAGDSRVIDPEDTRNKDQTTGATDPPLRLDNMQAALTSKAAVVSGAQRLSRAASNGTSQKVAMKSRSTYQVQVVVGEDEPQDNALKRFRREVMSAGVIPEVRRRRYFENAVDAKKRKTKESRMAMKRQQAVRSFSQVSGQEPAPFSDMFGSADEIDLYF